MLHLCAVHHETVSRTSMASEAVGPHYAADDLVVVTRTATQNRPNDRYTA